MRRHRPSELSSNIGDHSTTVAGVEIQSDEYVKQWAVVMEDVQGMASPNLK